MSLIVSISTKGDGWPIQVFRWLEWGRSRAAGPGLLILARNWVPHVRCRDVGCSIRPSAMIKPGTKFGKRLGSEPEDPRDYFSGGGVEPPRSCLRRIPNNCA
jgi:hypothetical protein